jgi:hypothetical protein
MAARNPRAIIGFGVMAAAIIAAVLIVVVSLRTPEPPARPVAPVFPKAPEAHPVIPSPEQPVAHPPQAFCEARDIAMTSISLRNMYKAALSVAKAAEKKGAPASCHGTSVDQGLAQTFDNFSKRTGACVARDSELDSQWAQLDSSVLAFGRCIDCTHPRDDRLTGCQRMIELVDAAEKSMR